MQLCQNPPGTGEPVIVAIPAGVAQSYVIPKLRNLDSCYPTLCEDDLIVNMNQIKDLDGRYELAETSQMGRG
jgi:hypothetical protein